MARALAWREIVTTKQPLGRRIDSEIGSHNSSSRDGFGAGVLKGWQLNSTVMLLKANALKGFKLDCLDGEIGSVREFYFDDQHWTIRYLVADTGGWLNGRMVLISPYALLGAVKENEAIAVNLTQQQIQESPSWDSDKPVSRQFEVDYHGYYGWPMYWGGPLMWGAYPYLVRDPENWSAPEETEHSWDPHLRSTDAVTGHDIQATDGDIGHVVDFIIDDENWAIRYLVVDTGHWWPGKKVLVSPVWIERVSWSELKVFVKLNREAVKASPEYTDEALVTREYESGLFRHYGSDGYWSHEKEQA